MGNLISSPLETFRDGRVPRRPNGSNGAIAEAVACPVQSRGMRRTLFTALLLALLGASACAPLRASRLYVSGTEALDRGDVTRAVDDLEQAAALVPEASEVQNHLGLAYGAAGRDDDALAAFERAVTLDCDNQAAQQNLHAAQSRASGAPSR